MSSRDLTFASAITSTCSGATTSLEGVTAIERSATVVTVTATHAESVVQRIAPLLPTYHLVQLMLSVYGYEAQGSSEATHRAVLIGFTALMLGLFWVLFSRKERNA